MSWPSRALMRHEVGVGHLARLIAGASRRSGSAARRLAVVQEVQRRLVVRVRGHQHARCAQPQSAGSIWLMRPGSLASTLACSAFMCRIEPDRARARPRRSARPAACGAPESSTSVPSKSKPLTLTSGSRSDWPVARSMPIQRVRAVRARGVLRDVDLRRRRAIVPEIDGCRLRSRRAGSRASSFHAASSASARARCRRALR